MFVCFFAFQGQLELLTSNSKQEFLPLDPTQDLIFPPEVIVRILSMLSKETHSEVDSDDYIFHFCLVPIWI